MAFEGGLGGILELLWEDLRLWVHFGVILWSLLAFEGGFGGTLGHFGVTLGALAAYGGAFGVTLR